MKYFSFLIIVLLLVISFGRVFAEEPTLPPGLGIDVSTAVEPTMQNEKSRQLADWAKNLPFDFSGFLDARVGARISEDDHEKDFSLDVRIQTNSRFIL